MRYLSKSVFPAEKEKGSLTLFLIKSAKMGESWLMTNCLSAAKYLSLSLAQLCLAFCNISKNGAILTTPGSNASRRCWLTETQRQLVSEKWCLVMTTKPFYIGVSCFKGFLFTNPLKMNIFPLMTLLTFSPVLILCTANLPLERDLVFDEQLHWNTQHLTFDHFSFKLFITYYIHTKWIILTNNRE